MNRFTIPNYLLVILLLLFVNLATASWFPRVWMDEVMFADPAANLYQGSGFVSTAWPVQKADELFSGNVPLYSLVLSQWYHIFGFGIVQTRGLGVVLWCCATMITCLAVKRLGFITTSSGLAVLAFLAMTSGTVAISYRTGRYDPLMFFSVACCLYGFSIKSARWRLAVIFLSSTLFAISGIVLLFYAATMAALLSFFVPRKSMKEIICVGLGAAFGVVLLYSFFRLCGTWDRFLATVNELKAIVRRPEDSFFMHFRGIKKILLQDKCALMVLGMLGLLALSRWKSRSPRQRQIILFCLLAGCVMPYVINIIYSYSFYYYWLSYIPLCVGLISALEGENGRLFGGAPYVLGMIGCVILSWGLSRYLLQGFWDGEDRDSQKIDALVESGIERTDVVVSNFQGFYSLHRHNIHGLYGFYVNRLTATEKAAVNCLLIDPNEIEHYQEVLGGSWTKVGSDYVHQPRFPIPALLNFKTQHLSDKSNAGFKLAVFKRTAETL